VLVVTKTGTVVVGDGTKEVEVTERIVGTSVLGATGIVASGCEVGEVVLLVTGVSSERTEVPPHPKSPIRASRKKPAIRV
jgi:hypothetical protein